MYKLNSLKFGNVSDILSGLYEKVAIRDESLQNALKFSLGA